MKKFSVVLFILISTLYSCGGDDFFSDPQIPSKASVSSLMQQKLAFHCNIHNLTYGFTKQTDDKYKVLNMPCPICKYDSAIIFMKKNELTYIQLLCPIDSTWTSFAITTDDKLFLLRDKKPFNPIIPLIGDFKGISLDQLSTDIKNNQNKDYTHFPDCWCDSCFKKVRLAAIKVKQDSITTFHNSINSITGLTFTTYPINTGLPPDRRARAIQILDSIESIMPALNSDYKKQYSTINNFIGYFNGYRQDYLYCNKTGTPMGSYVTKDIYMSKVFSDEYISDTIIINIGGGPDYRLDGSGVTIPLFKTKSTTNTIQSVKSLQSSGRKSLTHAAKSKVRRSNVESQYQLLNDFTPGNIDFLPSQYLPRKYNTYTTSEFIIFHPQKGN